MTVQTNNGRIILQNDSLQNLQPAPQPQPQAMTAANTSTMRLQPKRVSIQPKRAKSPSVVDFAPMCNRWLVNTMGNTMEHVEPLNGYGRIILTKFVPTLACDPIMPIPLVRFTGWGGWLHNTAWRELAHLMIDLESPWATSSQRYVRWANRFARIIVKRSNPFLKPDEHIYYANQIYECVANPYRNDWREIIQKQNNRR